MNASFFYVILKLKIYIWDAWLQQYEKIPMRTETIDVCSSYYLYYTMLSTYLFSSTWLYFSRTLAWKEKCNDYHKLNYLIKQSKELRIEDKLLVYCLISCRPEIWVGLALLDSQLRIPQGG